MSKYLNLDGLGTFWDKIKSTFVKKNDNGYVDKSQIPVKSYRAGGSRAYVRICRCKAPTSSTSPTIDCNIRMGDATVRVIIQGYNSWRANVIGYLNSTSFKFYAHQVVVEEETFYDIIAYHTTYCKGFYSPQFLYDYDTVDFSYWAAPYTEYTPTSEEEIPYIMLAKSTASSSNAPVKVNQFGGLSPITVDSAPTAGHTANLVSSDGIKSALDGKATKAGLSSGATKCKITYNADGIVTGGADLTDSDIPGLNASKITSGTLPVSRGGTGKNSVTANSYLKGDGTGALVERTYAEVRTDLGISAGANKVEASTTNGNIKIDGTETTVYNHPAGNAASKTGVPTANASPAFGGTFKVNQIATDSTSHVKTLTERTITIPNTTGNASTAGLTKLYTETGTNTDGTMTQSAIKTALDAKENTKVTQTKDDSGTTAYPLLMAGATDPNGSATTSRYDSNVKLTPSTNTISANISGNAATADTATNVNLVGDVKTASTTNGDTIRVKAGSGTAAEITIVNAKHAASADSATSATSATTATNSTKSEVTADTTSKLYLIGSTGSSGQQALKTDTGIYATTQSGQLHATKFDVNGGCTLQYNSTTKSLDFVFA